VGHAVEAYRDEFANGLLALPVLESELVHIATPSRRPALIQLDAKPRSLTPQRALQPGEQYRFHFDMTERIGESAASAAPRVQPSTLRSL